jgi:hypothetical protein
MVLTSRLKENKLLINKETGTYSRIFKVVESSGLIYLINFNGNGRDVKLPERYSIVAIKRKLENKEIELLDSDVFNKYIPEAEWTQAQKKVISRAWSKIEKLVKGDALIDFEERFKIIKELSTEEPTVSIPTLLEWIKKFLVGGMVKSAIAPNFEKCGGSGKKRPTRKISDSAVDIIIKGVKKFWLNTELTIEAARLKTKRTFYNKEIHHFPFPDYYAFRRYLHQNFPDAFENKVTRHGRKNAQRDSRLKRGRSTSIATGPGDQFQIDWTSMNVNLVASFNRSLGIGIPILYVVIDTYSRLIVGILITKRTPNWDTFMLAIHNAARNKKKFAALYDLDINEGEWLGECVPQSFIADGEAANLKANTLGNNFNITLANPESYRGDFKGIVERCHLTIKSNYKTTLDSFGATVDRYGKRLGVDARKEACLTLEDLYRITIKVVMDYNRKTMKTYPNEAELLADLIGKTPNEIWKHAVEDGFGVQRSYDEDKLKLELIKKYHFTPDSEGFNINGHQFIPQESSDQSILENLINKPRGAGKQIICYDPNYMPDKYWLYKNRFIRLRKLGEDEQEYCNEMEMLAVNKLYNEDAKKNKDGEDERKMITTDFIEETAKHAKQIQGSKVKVDPESTQAALKIQIALEKTKDFDRPAILVEPQLSMTQTSSDASDNDYVFSFYEDELKNTDKQLNK